MVEAIKSEKSREEIHTGALILVTGGAGYVGVPLVELLLKKGYQVRVFDQLYFGERSLEHLKSKFELIQGDIRTIKPEVLKGVKAVIHLAGLSNDPTAEFNPAANYEINTLGTRRLALIARQEGVRRLAFASSASVYDRGLEAEDIIQSEDSSVKPRAAYAVSKHRAELELIKLVDRDFCPVILRQGTCFGFSPRMRFDLVVNSMVKSALKGGEIKVFCGGRQWRPLVDVQDVASAYVAAVEAPEDKVQGEIFNISHKNYRMRKLAHLVKMAINQLKAGDVNGDQRKTWGKYDFLPEVKIEVDYSARKDRSYRIYNTKAEKVLGFKPRVSVEESVINMVNEIYRWGYINFDHPWYYNINWMTLLTERESTFEDIKKIL